MAEPDELYTLRAQYWLGHYRLALEEGKAISRRPMAPHLKTEREEFILRAHLALGEYDKVLKETQSSTQPGLRALGIHATYLTSNDKDEVISSLKACLALPECANSTSFQLTACHIFLEHGLTREALQCVHLGIAMDHLALSLQIYLKINRLDLAENQLRLLKQADEDSILTQLCSAYLSIATGRSAIHDATHVLSMLSEQYGPSVSLLNLSAVAQMTAENYEAAEGILEEAAKEEDNAVDTLINTIVCALNMGKGLDSVSDTIDTLKKKWPSHPFVEGLERVDSAFDRESIKYAVKA